jgi:NAD(P)-dependent dehydrogenase (short-subunit alcohol dehydrogenase family)
MVELRLSGKVAIVTGAASGIGRAAAIRLATEGANVLAVDLNGDGLAETAKKISGAGGPQGRWWLTSRKPPIASAS